MKNSFYSPWWQRGWLLIHNSLVLSIHIWVALEQENGTNPKSLDLISSKSVIRIFMFIDFCLSRLKNPSSAWCFLFVFPVTCHLSLDYSKPSLDWIKDCSIWIGQYWLQIENSYFMWRRTFYTIPLCQGCYLLDSSCTLDNWASYTLGKSTGTAGDIQCCSPRSNL